MRGLSLLEERDRLRAALLSSIGHDLRTPLTGITAAIEALAGEHPDAAALPVARAEASRLRRFLDNLVELVRLDAGGIRLDVEPVDLTDSSEEPPAELQSQMSISDAVFSLKHK